MSTRPWEVMLDFRFQRAAVAVRQATLVVLMGASLALGSSVIAQAELRYDALDSSAIAIAAYEASKDQCTYSDRMGKALGEIDAFLTRRSAYLWEEAKRLGPDGLIGPRNLGRMQGTSDCKTYGVLIGHVAVVYMNAVDFDQSVFAEFSQLTAGGGRSRSGQMEARPQQPPPRDPAAEAIAEYKRLHPDMNRSAETGNFGSNLRRQPSGNGGAAAPRPTPPRQPSESSPPLEGGTLPSNSAIRPLDPPVQPSPSASSQDLAQPPRPLCYAPGYCAVRLGPPVWICPQASSLALPTPDIKRAARCVQISSNLAAEVTPGEGETIALLNLHDRSSTLPTRFYVARADLVGLELKPVPTPAGRGWCRPDDWCVIVVGAVFCKDRTAYERIMSGPSGDARRTAIMAEPACRLLIPGNVLKPGGLPTTEDPPLLIKVEHPVLGEGWANAKAFGVVSYNPPVRYTSQISDLVVSVEKSPSLAGVSLAAQGTNEASGTFRTGQRERLIYCKNFGGEEDANAFRNCVGDTDTALTIKADCYARRILVDGQRYELHERPSDMPPDHHVDPSRRWLFRDMTSGDWLDGSIRSAEATVGTAFNALCPGVNPEATSSTIYRASDAEFPRELQGRWFDNKRACADPRRNEPDYEDHSWMEISAESRVGSREFEFTQRINAIRAVGRGVWEIDGSHRIDDPSVPEIFQSSTYRLTRDGLELGHGAQASKWVRCR